MGDNFADSQYIMSTEQCLKRIYRRHPLSAQS